MAMAHQPEVQLLQEELHTKKESESPWLNELLQRDVPFKDIFQSQLLYTGDSISSEYTAISGLKKNYSDSEHRYSMNALCSAGQTENNMQSQKFRTDDKFLSQICQSNGECSASSYMVSGLKAAALSGNDVSRMVLPTQGQGALEGTASSNRSNEIAYGRLQFSSSVSPLEQLTGACRAALVDAHCNGLIKVGIAQNGTNLKGSLLQVPTLVGIGGIKKGKKRSRASRRPPTTVLEADSANFRSMVQQLTGIHSSPLPSESLPRRGSDFSNFTVGRPSSHTRPSVGFGGDNVPEHFASMPALQLLGQSLISRAFDSHIYSTDLSSTETALSHLIHERNQIVPYNMLATGISDGSPLNTFPVVDRSCSMLQNQRFQ